MKTAGIIAEYNPFHNGHAYQIKKVRQETGADYVIVMMSGDFVQRGEPAIMDKYSRTKMALANGADLVLELPVFFSCAGAEYFARGGVSVLDRLGCIDTLCFGTEQEHLSDFDEVASLLVSEPEAYQQLLASFLKQGHGYPAARFAALSDFLHTDISFLRQPNNILALEYLCILKKLNSNIEPYAIQRTGAGYHSRTLEHSFSSATAIRHALLHKQSEDSDDISRYLTETADLQDYMPSSAWQILQDYMNICGPLEIQDFSSVMQYRLLLTQTAEDLQRCFDIDRFLANRIFQNRFAFQDFSDFVRLLTSKNQTRGHIQRALFHLLLEIPEPQTPQEQFPQYTRILGMHREASCILKSIKQNSAIPVLTKLADASKTIQDFPVSELQRKVACCQLQQTTLASHIYESVLSQKYHTHFRHENTRQIVIL